MKRWLGIAWTVLALVIISGCKDEELPGEGDTFLRIFGTDGEDKGLDVVEANGGFAVTGVLYSDSTDSAGQMLEGDIFLLFTDANGEPIHYTTYSNPGADTGKELLLLDDGGFLIVGDQSYGAHGGVDVALIRTDAAGNVLWSRQYGGSGGDYGSAVVQSSDGNWVVVGYTNSTPNGDVDVYAIKVDTDGNVVWETQVGTDQEERAFSVVATSDDGVVMAGSAVDTSLGYQAVAWKLLADGSQDWEYRQGGPSEDKGYSIDQWSDGSLVFAGYTSDGAGYDIFVTELESDGSLVSTTTFGGADYDRVLSQHLLPQADGSLYGVAYTQSYGRGANDVYWYQLEKTDTGYALAKDETYGGSNDDIGANIIKISNGFVIVGYSKSFTFGDGNDAVLIQVDGSGKLN